MVRSSIWIMVPGIRFEANGEAKDVFFRGEFLREMWNFFPAATICTSQGAIATNSRP